LRVFKRLGDELEQFVEDFVCSIDLRAALTPIDAIPSKLLPIRTVVCHGKRPPHYRKAMAAALWPWSHALPVRAATLASESHRPAAVLNQRPNCRTVSTQPYPFTPKSVHAQTR
jgi:hypothetical protein